jgi:hypothetical protein
VVRKKPAINHQPPSCKGGKICRPYSGAGGCSESQGSCRRNSTGFQPTDAHMLRPMISKAMKPQKIEATPRNPR